MDAEFDFPESATPEKSYAIVTYARTGSYMLCEKLWRTGQMGAPFEYFNHFNLMLQMINRLHADSIQGYVEKLFKVRTSPNGVFGMKLFPEHLQFMHLASIVWLFPNLKFIYLTRKDILAQTVSLTRAMQTSQWSNYDVPQGEATYDYKALIYNLGRIEKAMLFWEGYFKNKNIQPYRVTYENLVKQPDELTEKILKHFGIEQDPKLAVELPLFEKQTYKNSFNWNERFNEDLKKYNPRIYEKYATS